jgi:hypothetical protein
MIFFFLDTSVAKIAPSGAYVASGDVGGKLIVWDLLNKIEHITKFQKKTFSQGLYS